MDHSLALDTATETLGNGDLTIHIRVDDPDYDVSATGEDQIAENTTTSSNRGPLKIYVSRGSEAVTLATAGGDTAQDGVITATTTPVDGGTDITVTVQENLVQSQRLLQILEYSNWT